MSIPLIKRQIKGKDSSRSADTLSISLKLSVRKIGLWATTCSPLLQAPK